MSSIKTPPFTIYNASAGSGKTHTLVRSFLYRLLSSPYPNQVQRLLAITFTNKAAQEMKQRILEKLECFASGTCSIIIDSNPYTFSDLNMEKYFSKNSLIKVAFNSVEKDLSKKISYLVNNKKRISQYSKEIYVEASKLLKTWDERIIIEKKLIENIK